MPQACNFIKEETLAQVFSCKFCASFKNTFLYRTPPVAAYLMLEFSSLDNKFSTYTEVLANTRNHRHSFQILSYKTIVILPLQIGMIKNVKAIPQHEVLERYDERNEIVNKHVMNKYF